MLRAGEAEPPTNGMKSNRDSLEFAALAPVFVGSSVRAAFLEPKEVGSLAKVLVKRMISVFLRSPRQIAVLLPKKIGAFAEVILQTVSCTF